MTRLNVAREVLSDPAQAFWVTGVAICQLGKFFSDLYVFVSPFLVGKNEANWEPLLTLKDLKANQHIFFHPKILNVKTSGFKN